eukprot:487323-Rhodomonas_salina.1
MEGLRGDLEQAKGELERVREEAAQQSGSGAQVASEIQAIAPEVPEVVPEDGAADDDGWGAWGGDEDVEQIAAEANAVESSEQAGTAQGHVTAEDVDAAVGRAEAEAKARMELEEAREELGRFEEEMEGLRGELEQ